VKAAAEMVQAGYVAAVALQPEQCAAAEEKAQQADEKVEQDEQAAAGEFQWVQAASDVVQGV
jgi:hypothetical protein